LDNQIDMIIAKIQRQKRNLSGQALAHFIDLSGGLDPTQFIGQLKTMTAPEAKKHLLGQAQLLDILEEGGVNAGRPLIISLHDDQLSYHSRGYGKGQTPQDYLDEFNQFINTNLNTIAALQVVCTRPQELTRESLKSLKLELDRHHFTETQLNTAWQELKNEDIAADIISYIRRYALGSALISHAERIKMAVDKLRQQYNFSKMQLDWLAKIEKTLLAESVIDRATFDAGAFRTEGGYNRANKIFNGQLDLYLQELNRYLYDDGGKTA